VKEKHSSKNWLKPLIFLFVILAFLFIARYFGLGQKLGELKDWIKDIGIWGPLVFIALYAVATVLAIPGSAMTVAAGSIFGSILGVIIVSIASTLGASLAFLVARYFARDAISQSLSKNEKFHKLDDLTEKHGAIIVAITRLVPLFPFTLLNYGFGLTKVPFKIYVLWSWLCMLPGTVLYVVGADAITRIMTQGSIPWVLIAIFLVFIIILTILVRHARKILKEKERAE